MIRKLIFPILMVLIFSGCQKSENISPIPAITFNSLSVSSSGVKDTASVLTISYVDGDGDLGILSDQTSPPYNFIIATYEKTGGTFQYLINQDAYIPNLTPKSRIKNISGDISDVLQLPLNKINDTLRYEVYIIDRAGNHSNKITTPEIVISTK